MANPQKNEQPSTYVVQDRQNKDELTRLTIQDQLITEGVGGVLPEQADPTRFQRVLDVGCGTGGWAMEAARTYPTMSLVGIDISGRMVEYARAQAVEQQISERVEFQVMDALGTLEFPAGSFDLVNLRLGVSWVRTWDWPKMLGEFRRVTRPGGVIRITESESILPGNSAALTQFYAMFMCALYRSGHLFAQETDGLTAHIAPLLSQHGCKEVQTQTYALEYKGGTSRAQDYYETLVRGMKTGRPFLEKWGCIAQEYDQICQQALKDVQQDGFRTTWNFLLAWGTI